MTRDERLEMIRRCRYLLSSRHFIQDDFRQVDVMVGGLRVPISVETSPDPYSTMRLLMVYIGAVGVSIGTMNEAFDEHNARRQWNHEDFLKHVLVALREQMVLDDLANA